MSLPQDQINIIITIERVGSMLSITAIFTIIFSYRACKQLRTVPNLFLIYASLANAGAGIACMMGYDGLKAGHDSALCQIQAFLLEMFMQSDPFWSLAMAINVCLVFFFGANPSTFQKYIWLYCLLCYGLPALPAITLLFVHTERRGKVYGDATLWCWIGPEWAFLRIWTYYIPIWICIFLSFAIYFAVGYQVFHRRNQLRNLTYSRSAERDGKQSSVSDECRESGDKGLTRPEFTVTTEVEVTSVANINAIIWPASNSQLLSPTVPPLLSPASASSPTGRSGEWSRLEEYLEPHKPPITFPNARLETTCVSTSAGKIFKESQAQRSIWGQIREKLRRLDPVKLAYLQTSFVFAISVLVTWMPSSVNRIHNLVHPDTVDFGLNVASAVVLPLQGVWNAVIFFTTSWGAVKEAMGQVVQQWRGEEEEKQGVRHHHEGDFRDMDNGSRVWSGESDGMDYEMTARGRLSERE